MVHRSGRKKGEGIVGRGHCGQCVSIENICANPKCGCHDPQGAKCRTCPTGLYIFVPPDSRITDIEEWLRKKHMEDAA